MHGPATVGWLMTALCAVTGLACVLRTRRAGRPERAEAAHEAVMGFAMAAMAVPALWTGRPLAPDGTAAVFALLFGGLTVAGARHARGARDDGHGRGARGRHLHHTVGAAAMCYLAAAMAFSSPAGHAAGHTGHGAPGAGLPLLTGALLVYFAGSVLRTGVRLLPAGAPGTVVGAAPAAGMAAACRLAMGTGMCAMLLTM
ncbi:MULTISPECIES: DUF5134 domain-containing protein [Streptomyces]|uniref:DUF5134 domain-containing protein n=1 Tax=Streptomyces TaxID=1883 RepID=UPI0004CC1247|nr:DUF5134 domain-containing protein [Streptomyces sp. NRRL F-5053]